MTSYLLNCGFGRNTLFNTIEVSGRLKATINFITIKFSQTEDIRVVKKRSEEKIGRASNAGKCKCSVKDMDMDMDMDMDQKTYNPVD